MLGDWPTGEGEMAARIRAFDWRTTPLGPTSGWPQSLKTALDICLGSGFPSFLWWGPELIEIHNDAALPIMRGHRACLGRPASAVWREGSDLGRLVKEVLVTAQAVTRRDLQLLSGPEETWFTVSCSALRDEAGAVAGVMAMAVEVTTKTSADTPHQTMLLAELQHRTRNLLGVIRSVARRTAETSEDLESFLTHFDGRLSAIARTQTALTRNHEVSTGLDAVILEEFLAAAGADQVTLDGPEVQLSGKMADSISLAVHELVTNALKYGALTTPKGHVYVTWELAKHDGHTVLALEWIESGVGIIDVQPSRFGFGRRLLEKALPYELGALTSLRFAPGGLRASLEVPLPATSEHEG